ncbi:hypothetical protein [Proteiniborus sp. MB09-C3]|uniref:hypothetical protein n=1 Tax=Proteiniborus sp. MB09-C3 TaxID=3050072 RepID=UPI0025543BC6|nr:hypothetical protein [Proteiniborus sp. MB09-C3]WIV13204.1 hypothetical protein QO263_05705 [Proteiniborus sp. MB09-C3]
MLRLYDDIEKKLRKDNTYETIMINGLEVDKPGIVGIFFYPGREDEETMDAEVGEFIKCHVQVNNRPGEAGIQESSDYLRKFIKEIEREISETEGLEYVYCKHLGAKVKPIQKNVHGVAGASCDIEIQYILTERTR